MKSSTPPSNKNYGLSLEDPVLLTSIFVSEIYLNKLMTLDGNLSYRRLGSRMISLFKKPIDIYEITRHGVVFCHIYIYAYHHENIEEVPQEFINKLKPRWDPSEKFALIERFFRDTEEYMEFLARGKELVKAHDNAKCFAILKAEGDRLIYKLIWITNGKSIIEKVFPFKATEENVEQFNRGTKITAERLKIFLETGDQNLIPKDQSAFGDLTYVKRDIKFDYSKGTEPYRDECWTNIETGVKELIRIPIRKLRDTPVIKYHKFTC